MRNRAFPQIALLLAICLVATLTVHAGPVTMSSVKHTVGSHKASGSTSSLRLSNAYEDHTSTSTDPGATEDPQQEGPTVQTGEDIVVTQEDCDCEQPPAVGGGFPKWPFLGLIAIPFLFIRRKKDCEYNGVGVNPCIPTTPPTTPTPPVPEPTTLLLFGSGLLALGAGVRRRYHRDRNQSIENEKGEGQ